MHIPLGNDVEAVTRRNLLSDAIQHETIPLEKAIEMIQENQANLENVTYTELCNFRSVVGDVLKVCNMRHNDIVQVDYKLAAQQDKLLKENPRLNTLSKETTMKITVNHVLAHQSSYVQSIEQGIIPLEHAIQLAEDLESQLNDQSLSIDLGAVYIIQQAAFARAAALNGRLYNLNARITDMQVNRH